MPVCKIMCSICPMKANLHSNHLHQWPLCHSCYWIKLFYYESTCKLDGKLELSNRQLRLWVHSGPCIFYNLYWAPTWWCRCQFVLVCTFERRKIHKTVWHIQLTKIMALTQFEWYQFIGYLDIATLHTFSNKAKQNRTNQYHLASLMMLLLVFIQYLTLYAMRFIAFHCIASHAIAPINDKEDCRLPPMMIDGCCQQPAIISSSPLSSSTLFHLSLPYFLAKAHVFFTLISCQIA